MEAVVERRFQQGLFRLLRRQARFLQRRPFFHEATHILRRDMLGQIEHEALRTGIDAQRTPVRRRPSGSDGRAETSTPGFPRPRVAQKFLP